MGPIYTLPPELLATIFLRFVLREVLTYEANIRDWNIYRRESPRPYSWLKITHVCRLWRDVALSTPRLFSHLIVSRQDRVEEMLRASATLPLHIISGDQNQDSRDSLGAYIRILSHFDRVTDATLSLTDQSLALLRDPDTVKSVNASALQRLYIGFWNVEYHAIDLTPLLMAGVDFPALHELMLEGGKLSLCKPMLSSSLQRLHLKGSDYPITPDRLSIYLRELSNLTHLTVEDIMDEADVTRLQNPDTWTPSRTVTLPYLRRLVVVESHPGCLFQLFAYLIYPADTYVTAGRSFTSLYVPSSMFIHTLIPKLRGKGLTGPVPQLLRMTLEQCDRSDASLKVWGVTAESDLSAHRDPTGQPMQPFLELLTASSGSSMDEMAILLSYLSFPKVVDLHVSEVALGSDGWIRLLHTVPALQSLSVIGKSCGDSLPRSFSSRMVPQLKFIRYDLSWSLMPIEQFSNLVETLAARKRQGRRLDTLKIVLAEAYDDLQVRDELTDSFYGVVRSVRFIRKRKE